jgi:hypothetical protein
VALVPLVGAAAVGDPAALAVAAGAPAALEALDDGEAGLVAVGPPADELPPLQAVQRASMTVTGRAPTARRWHWYICRFLRLSRT